MSSCFCIGSFIKFRYFISRLWTIKLWVLLNGASTSTQLHPPPSTSTQLISTSTQLIPASTQLISTSTQLHPPPPSSFQPPPSSLQHPQQQLNQNIARNCAISPNLGRKIKSCPFWLKISKHGILEVLIPNPDLDLWNSDPKIHFWANLYPKIQSYPVCLKIGAHYISRMLILNPHLDFWNFDPKIHFCTNLGPKTQSCLFCLKIGIHVISRILILIPTLVFSISNPNFLFGQIWAIKVKFVHFAWKLAHFVSWGCGFLFQD